MIPGPKPLEISEYLPIDRCAEGYCYATPKEGEKFMGIPFGWYETGSMAFIEISKDGKVISTVNVYDVSEIHFK